MHNRRTFMKTLSATGAAIYASDLVGELVAQTARGRVLDSRFKGLSDVALGEAKRLGCTYADIRFTRNITDSVAVRDRVVVDSFGFGGAGREESAGFGVRVIHSGVWGFASSPLVTEDEIKTIAARATDVAKASALAKKFDVRLSPVEAYVDYWATPVTTVADTVSLDDKIAFLLKINELGLKQPDVLRIQSQMAFDFEWKYLATSEGSYLEQEIHRASPGFTVTARKNGKVKQRTFSVAPRSAGYEVITEAKMLENVERICAEAAEHCTAPPVTVGLKDLVITPAHAMLTIHEIVAHPTELDRVVGYEANYAGTSFISLADVGKMTVGSKLFNITADRTLPGGMCTVGYDDDGVKCAAVAAGPRGQARRPADQPRDRALPEAGLLARLHVRDVVAQLPVPAHAQRPPRRRPAGVADARADHRRHQGRRADRRPRQLLHRPAALQRSVRRRRLLGDQGRQEDPDGQRRHLQRHHDRLLEQPRRHLGTGVVGDVRHHR